MLFTIWRGGSTATSDIGILDLETNEHQRIVQGGCCAQFVAPNLIVYSRRSELFAVELDLEERTTIGTGVSVLDGVLAASSSDMPVFALSESGSLAYAPGGWQRWAQEIVWVQANGSTIPVDSEGRVLGGAPRIAPDGRSIVYHTHGDRFDILRFDLQSSTLSPIWVEPSWETNAMWSSDGKRVLFSSSREGPHELYIADLARSGSLERLTSGGSRPRTGNSWSVLDVVAFEETSSDTSSDIWAIELGGDRQPLPVAVTPAAETDGRFSLDGKFIAYLTDASGRTEVQLAPYPITGESWQISRSGATAISGWAPDSRAVYYVHEQSLMERRLDADRRPVGDEREWLTLPANMAVDVEVDVANDRGLVPLEPDLPNITWVHLAPNWHIELQRILQLQRD